MLGLFSYLTLAALGQTGAAQPAAEPQAARLCVYYFNKPASHDVDVYFLPLSKSPAKSPPGGKAGWDTLANRWMEAKTGLKDVAQAQDCHYGDQAAKAAAGYVDGKSFENRLTPPGTTRYHRVDAPDDWATRAPGDDEVSGLKTATLAFQDGSRTAEQIGYQSAQVDLKYRFVVCNSDIYLAYGIDPSSVKPSAGYWVKGRRVEAAALSPPDLQTVSFTAKVESAGEAGVIVDYPVADPHAGKAQGYGCFDGQLKKVGSVAEVAGPAIGNNPGPDRLRAFLDQGLTLADARLPEPLRNAALEAPAPVADLAVAARVAGQFQADADSGAQPDAAADASTQALNAANASRAAAQAAAVQQSQADAAAANEAYEAGLRAAEEAKAKFDRDQAAYQDALAAAQAAQAKYDADVQAWREKNHKD